jgi:ribokinase
MDVPRVVVVGSSNTDFVLRVPHLPGRGETVLSTDLSVGGGGKGVNQAVAAARLGAHVTLVARVGDDVTGRKALHDIKHEGVEVRDIRLTRSGSSGIAMILVDPAGENMIAVAAGANLALSPADIVRAESAIKMSDCVLIQLEIPLESVVAAASMARRHAVRVVLNPAPAAKLDPSLLAMVDVLTPNTSEAASLANETVANPAEAARAAQRLCDLGARAVVITMASQGALVFAQGEAVLIPAFRVKEVDSTAAGDAFSAALAVALARGLSLIEAAQQASAAGALTVTKLGAMASLPSEAEIREFLASYGMPPGPIPMK